MITPVLRESGVSLKTISSIKSKLNNIELEPSKIYVHGSEPLITDARNSQSCFLSPEKLPKNFVKKIFSLLKQKWDVDQNDYVIEVAQYAQYRKGDFFQWHHDQIPIDSDDKKMRVFTVVLMLSSSEDYDGGDFEYKDYFENKYKVENFNKGDFIVFPSRLQHQVTKVKSGVRETLTMWLLSYPIKRKN